MAPIGHPGLEWLTTQVRLGWSKRTSVLKSLDGNLEPLFLRQNRLHDALGRFINGEVTYSHRVIRRRPRGVGFLSPAGWITEEYAHLKAIGGQDPSADEVINVGFYQGSNRAVHRLRTQLADLDTDDLAGAYVHGSVGSHEEIDYSDLDMLVILGDRVMTDERRLISVARRLNRWKKHLYAHDPLQHHGWFVLTAYDLEHYCEAYFPVALFTYAKSLFEDRGRVLAIRRRAADYELSAAFIRMADSIQNQIEANQYPNNMYRLKSLLSRVMLLPALYVQARDGTGVWKAESFEMARKDFDPTIWAPMDQVSKVREQWSYKPSAVKRFILKGTGLPNALYRKHVSSPIPASINQICTGELYAGITHLVSVMRLRLESIRPLHPQSSVHDDAVSAP